MGQTRYPGRDEAQLLADVRPQPITLPAKAYESDGDMLVPQRSGRRVRAWVQFLTRDGIVTVQVDATAEGWNSKAVRLAGMLKDAIPWSCVVWAAAVSSR